MQLQGLWPLCADCRETDASQLGKSVQRQRRRERPWRREQRGQYYRWALLASEEYVGMIAYVRHITSRLDDFRRDLGLKLAIGSERYFRAREALSFCHGHGWRMTDFLRGVHTSNMTDGTWHFLMKYIQPSKEVLKPSGSHTALDYCIG